VLVDVHPATLSRWERGESSPAESQPVRRLVAWYAERAAKGAELTCLAAKQILSCALFNHSLGDTLSP
jgi:hypothetical protein